MYIEYICFKTMNVVFHKGVTVPILGMYDAHGFEVVEPNEAVQLQLASNDEQNWLTSQNGFGHTFTFH
mgnify:CR=1 FL=1